MAEETQGPDGRYEGSARTGNTVVGGCSVLHRDLSPGRPTTRRKSPATSDGAVSAVQGGLADYLTASHIDLLVDATHPFASTISQNADRACNNTNVERLAIRRPPWFPVPGDCWINVSDVSEAAGRLSEVGSRIFLTIGRQEVDAFEVCRDTWFLIRTIDLPEKPFSLIILRDSVGARAFRR